MDFQEQITNLEVAEADIIHDLYAAHFVPRGKSGPQKASTIRASNDYGEMDQNKTIDSNNDKSNTPMQGKD